MAVRHRKRSASHGSITNDTAESTRLQESCANRPAKSTGAWHKLHKFSNIVTGRLLLHEGKNALAKRRIHAAFRYLGRYETRNQHKPGEFQARQAGDHQIQE